MKTIASMMIVFLAWAACGLMGGIAALPHKPTLHPKEREVMTHHQAVIDGKTIPYTALAGTIILKDKNQKPTASVFFVAYTEDGVDPEKRPITFTYNGGPGFSSVWLQLGGVGPRRLSSKDAAFAPGPPYQISNNPYSILNKTDLVFIDPVGTGYSYPIGKFQPEDFWSVDGDVKSVGEFIEKYLSKFNRWNSPKFLLGESYGTTRSAALSYFLQENGVQLNGVILLSSILNFETASFSPGNDLSYILYLPSYAAVAWYHHKVSPAYKSLDALLQEVKAFAVGPYASALMKGDKLNPKIENAVALKLSDYCGVSADLWKKAKLRVNGEEFEKWLLAGEGEMTGRLDGRYVGYALEEVSPFRDYAVMLEATNGPFTAAMNNYLHNTLKYDTNRPYVMESDEVNEKWEWKHHSPGLTFDDWNGFLNVAPDLAMTMAANPHLLVMVNSGYFDLGTPFFATDYTFDHMELPKPLQSHLYIYNYMCGHMIYLHLPALKELHQNIDHFIDISLTPSQH